MLRFVVALQAEARPIVDRFRMEPVADDPAFRVYRGAAPGDGAGGDAWWLIVSGQGKAAAAAATAYLHLFSGGRPRRAWMNVGLGGHSGRAVGEAFVAHKISDPASGASWYPQLVIDAPCPTASLLTVGRMDEEYAPSWIYEMEAAGFFPIACRFSTSELVHCFKVISDNPDSTLSRRMSSSFVQELVESNLGRIEDFARGLAGLARELEAVNADPPGHTEILARWAFSIAEQRRLRRLLQRLHVLVPGTLFGGLDLHALREPRDVLRALETRLSAIPVRLPALADVATAGVASDDLR